MSPEMLERACESVFHGGAPTLTVEFQGGDPLIRFDLVSRAVLEITRLNASHGRRIRFVVASTLHQLDDAMCEFFARHDVYLSTSIDGPAALHNRNRPTPTRDAHKKTVAGIELARNRLGHDHVSALMTTTTQSLEHPEAIVDEYVRLGFSEIFLRPLSLYGFARKNARLLGYSLEAFARFYEAALGRICYWNRQGIELREAYGSILLNKLLCSLDAGYVDLQSPSGAGESVLVYNYDGYVYPSDEARMLAETGDTSLRLGRIGSALADLKQSAVYRSIVSASTVDTVPACSACAFQLACAPNPVDAQAQYGSLFTDPLVTDHCKRHQFLFDFWLCRLRTATPSELDMYYAWATPPQVDPALVSTQSKGLM